jgi:micrococcal nuclease
MQLRLSHFPGAVVPAAVLAATALVVSLALTAPRPVTHVDAPAPGNVAPPVAESDRRGAAASALRALVPVEVLRVIDGDTVEVRATIWLDQQVITRVRLRDIDAPELAGKCPQELRQAVQAREHLAGLLAGQRIFLSDLGRDKYGGRVLGRLLTAEGTEAGTAMLRAGLARPYTGGRRQPWC